MPADQRKKVILIGIIGFGNIASTLFDVLARDGRARFEAVAVLEAPPAVRARRRGGLLAKAVGTLRRWSGRS